MYGKREHICPNERNEELTLLMTLFGLARSSIITDWLYSGQKNVPFRGTISHTGPDSNNCWLISGPAFITIFWGARYHWTITFASSSSISLPLLYQACWASFFRLNSEWKTLFMCGHTSSSAFSTFLTKSNVSTWSRVSIEDLVRISQDFGSLCDYCISWFFHSHSPPFLLIVVGTDVVNGPAGGSFVVFANGFVVAGEIDDFVVVVGVVFPPSWDNFTSVYATDGLVVRRLAPSNLKTPWVRNFLLIHIWATACWMLVLTMRMRRIGLPRVGLPFESVVHEHPVLVAHLITALAWFFWRNYCSSKLAPFLFNFPHKILEFENLLKLSSTSGNSSKFLVSSIDVTLTGKAAGRSLGVKSWWRKVKKTTWPTWKPAKSGELG